MQNGLNAPRDPVPGLVKSLGLLDCTMLIMGSMIGSAIFIAPSLMAGYMPSPGLILLLWLIGGVITVLGALSYGELAASMPKAGGQYVFLREAYNPLTGFMYGWSLFFVIQVGFIAGVGVAFTKYLGVFLPVLSESNVVISAGPVSVNTVQIGAIAGILLLTVINIFGIRLGAMVQNIFTLSKIGGLLLLVSAAFLLGSGDWSNVTTGETAFRPEAVGMGFFAAFAVMMSKALFAYDAWNSVTFTAEEVRRPETTIPRALILGTALTTGVYALTNLAYFYILPAGAMALAPDNRVAAQVMELVLGPPGVTLIAIAILISTFGCNNGLILTGARVYYAMAKDGLFFKTVRDIHPKYHTPVKALLLQGIWASALTLTGTYSDLLTYTVFASLLFNALTVAGLFILRFRLPDMERPYKVRGYPFVPALYILIVLFFIVYIMIGDIRNSGLGLIIISTGFPVYFFWKRKRISKN